MAEQTFKSHRRYIPAYHFFALPVLILNVVAQVLYFLKYRTPYKLLMIVVAIALVVLGFAARYMVARVQDRVIRLEERLRLSNLLPAEMHAGINDLTAGQLVGLRFASDDEVAALAQRCMNGELTKGEQIKREIKNWRPDKLRA
ncbi:MAG: DUF6526 family protein [Gemmatimonadaceae bacterium]